MDTIPCPRCGYLCDMHHGRWKTTTSCPQCRKRFTFKSRRLSLQWVRLIVRLWPMLAFLAAALVLTLPAVVVFVTGKETDIAKALHANSQGDVARYCLYGAAVAVACGFWYIYHRRRIEEGVPG